MTQSEVSTSTVLWAEVGECLVLNDNNEQLRCLSCDRSEAVVPLLSLRYGGNLAWICSQCLPTLIHRPGQLVGRLADADKLTPAPPDHD
jgi:hypothetical protein